MGQHTRRSSLLLHGIPSRIPSRGIAGCYPGEPAVDGVGRSLVLLFLPRAGWQPPKRCSGLEMCANGGKAIKGLPKYQKP